MTRVGSKSSGFGGGSCAPFSAVLSFVLSFVCSAEGLAQAGGHPHVAPFAPGMSLLPPVAPTSKVSPMLNQPDGIWNMGESPDGVDIGGSHGPDPLGATMPSYRFLVNWTSAPPPHQNLEYAVARAWWTQRRRASRMPAEDPVRRRGRW